MTMSNKTTTCVLEQKADVISILFAISIVSRNLAKRLLQQNEQTKEGTGK